MYDKKRELIWSVLFVETGNNSDVISSSETSHVSHSWFISARAKEASACKPARCPLLDIATFSPFEGAPTSTWEDPVSLNGELFTAVTLNTCAAGKAYIIKFNHKIQWSQWCVPVDTFSFEHFQLWNHVRVFINTSLNLIFHFHQMFKDEHVWTRIASQ